MVRLLGRVLVVLLVLLSTGGIPLPTRAGRTGRACCSAKSSCAMMRMDNGAKSCCRVSAGGRTCGRSDQANQPTADCVLSAMGCGPIDATAPSSPVSLQFLLPAAPVATQGDLSPLARVAAAVGVADAELELSPRPPRAASVPVRRA